MSIYSKTTMDAMPGSCTECKLGERYGCVGDVKCLILREYFTGNVEPPYKERPDDCPLVELNTPPNDPLTISELREMDGEPVWSARWGVWGLVDTGFAAVITRKGDLDINDEGIHERLYRRKPEEGTI